VFIGNFAAKRNCPLALRTVAMLSAGLSDYAFFPSASDV
jgi:hypothetical protein